jgi:hypothetical protein
VDETKAVKKTAVCRIILIDGGAGYKMDTTCPASSVVSNPLKKY